MTKKSSRQNHDAYLALIDRFPLVPIRSEEQNDLAAEVIDELLDRFDELNSAEKDYFEVLSELIHSFESKWKEELEVSPRELLVFLLPLHTVASNVLQT